MMMKAARTIISREMVKPSSPTPSHLRTYNLSETDQRTAHVYMPIILYYPNNETCSLTPDDKVQMLKKSLSQSLTRYYPFAGKFHSPTAPYINCDDEGVVFVEAKNDSQMNMFQHISEDNDTVGQHYVDGMFWPKTPHRAGIVGVQVNHFACGGIAVGVTMSHRIGDGCNLGPFISYWASVARYDSTDHKEVLPLNPHFIQYPNTSNFLPPEASALFPKHINAVTRKFVFPNSKLSDLKNKVVAEGGSTLSTNNVTRVEVLTSLLCKTAVASSSSFKPYFINFPANIRDKFVPKLPHTTVGNYVACMMVTTEDESETSLSVLVSKIKEQKIELEQLQNVQMVHQRMESIISSLGTKEDFLDNIVNRSFLLSSFCGIPYSKFDFGWGNPEVVSIPC
ncbi:akuammiline synthase 1-like [Bidens hawaiensis]|uniref:akuammiline synthase 1-like n=1 Tax=Bidens hawaiensis TaxID=980011 RepID=UPI00404B96F5